MKHACRYLHRLGEAWFLHLPALKRRQISGLPEEGLKMLPEDVVACVGGQKDWSVCAQSVAT